MIGPIALAAAEALQIPAAAPPSAPFAQEIAAFVAADARAMPPRCATLFVGSSSIRLWPDLAKDFDFPLIQRGFGGATIRDVNRHFAQIVAPYRPSRIVLYAGENDIDSGESPQAVYRQVRRFLRLKNARLGTTPVVFVSVKPSPARFGQIDRQRALNRMVKRLAARRSDLLFLDTASAMIAAGGPRGELFGPDGLHLNRAGYDLWKRRIARVLSTWRAPRAPGCSAR